MALRIALDSNRYVDFCRQEPAAVDAIQRADAIFLPFVVVAELRCGFRCGQRAAANERTLAGFLRSERVSVLFPDEVSTHVYADLYASLRRAGTPIPTNDLWVAALCVQHDLVLFSRDAHFDLVPRVPRL